MSGNMIGRVLNNRYEITERVGIGGMAEVYRAHDTVLDRIVAVKVMRLSMQRTLRLLSASVKKLPLPQNYKAPIL